MSPVQLLLVLFPTFAILALGAVLGRTSRFDTGPVTRVTFDVLVPALAFEKLVRLDLPAGAVGGVAIGAGVAILGSLALGVLTLRLLRIRRPALLLPIALMNYVNIPFPVLNSAWGEEALALGVAFYAVATLLAFTLGVGLAAGRFEPGFLLRTPALLAVAVAVLVRVVGLRIPDLVLEPIAWLGSACIPLVLLVTGAELARIRFHDLGLSLLASVLRIGFGLGIGLAYAAVTGLSGLPRSVFVFDAAMPSAMMCALFARRYDRDAPLVASVVLVSTLIGLVTMPLLLSALS
jgi:predicted permease